MDLKILKLSNNLYALAKENNGLKCTIYVEKKELAKVYRILGEVINTKEPSAIVSSRS